LLDLRQRNADVIPAAGQRQSVVVAFLLWADRPLVIDAQGEGEGFAGIEDLESQRRIAAPIGAILPQPDTGKIRGLRDDLQRVRTAGTLLAAHRDPALVFAQMVRAVVEPER